MQSFPWNPLHWFLLLLLIGLGLVLISHTPRIVAIGCGIGVASLLLMALLGWRAPPLALLRSLETLHPTYDGEFSTLRGVIVLGGSMGDAHGHSDQRTIGAASARLESAARLHAAHQGWTLLFSGGGSGNGAAGNEADLAVAFLRGQGVDMSRVLLERDSRNTFENALLSAKAFPEQAIGEWLLVTSAAHMPRALATFKKAGWQVLPYPVDFHASESASAYDYSLSEGSALWGLWLRERLALTVYRLKGRL